ncbi:carboxymuconolactone decarboxylase family protein [Roseicyclus sp. F158]|uniref:Carboxymuconolactone decarboxylase family protein n=1 Tax=Tropicimonas omnivorans TaxID=3075590 RepID=A0ABU3DJ01_9RHOB|nr:carboxymuconolactone decarboxylase family protein [Roseicyclus sp. F158]MDT0683688.1 carboxymuconolactone decarboxylase family protein [Roseicyclus sp. F158]
MSEGPKNPFEAMMRASQDWAQSLNPALEGFSPGDLEALWPTMPRDAMEMWFGQGLNPQGLDAKTRLFLALAALVAQGATAEPQIRLTVRHALEAGATPREVAEVIGQMVVFGGVPAMSRAMQLAQGVFEETKKDG